jgi:hypothetical protein
MLNMHVFCALPGAGAPTKSALGALYRTLDHPHAKYSVFVLGEIPLVIKSLDKSGAWVLLQVSPRAATKELGHELASAGALAMKLIAKAVNSVKDNPAFAGPWSWDALEKLVPADSPLRSKPTTVGGISVPGDGQIMTAGVIFGEDPGASMGITWKPSSQDLDDQRPVPIADIIASKAASHG